MYQRVPPTPSVDETHVPSCSAAQASLTLTLTCSHHPYLPIIATGGMDATVSFYGVEM